MPKILKSIVVFTIVIVMIVNCFIVPIRSEAVAGGAAGFIAFACTPAGMAVCATALVLSGVAVVDQVACSDPNTPQYRYNYSYQDGQGNWVDSPTGICLANQVISAYNNGDAKLQGALMDLYNENNGIDPNAIDTYQLSNDIIDSLIAEGRGCYLTQLTNPDPVSGSRMSCFGDYGIITLDKNGNIIRMEVFANDGALCHFTQVSSVGSKEWDIARGLSVNAQTLYTIVGCGGDWRYVDGTKADTSALPHATPWAGTGTVNVAGVDVPVTYTPTGVSANLRDLIDSLQYPAIALNPSTALPYELSVPDVNIGELDKLKVPTGISTVFPFCLPFDFVRGLSLFSAKPATPRFEVPIEFKAIGLFEGFTYNLVVDFDKLELLAFISRWVSTFSFSMVLIILSTRIVKGAH